MNRSQVIDSHVPWSGPWLRTLPQRLLRNGATKLRRMLTSRFMLILVAAYVLVIMNPDDNTLARLGFESTHLNGALVALFCAMLLENQRPALILATGAAMILANAPEYWGLTGGLDRDYFSAAAFTLTVSPYFARL